MLILKNQTIKSFKSNKFSYLFYRNINHNINCACYECFILNYFKTESFINFMNNITNDNITILNTIFVTKYTKDCFFINSF